MIFELDKNNSIACHFLAELRDKDIQNDRLRFRKNLERLGEVLAYEVSKSLEYYPAQIQTVLGEKKTGLLKSQPAIVTILRAGLPFYEGFLNFFDRADSGFIGAFRVEGEDISVESTYKALGDLSGKDVIIVDPMLATGKSIVSTLEQLNSHGSPNRIHIVAAIAAPEGIEYVQNNLNLNFRLWVGSIDDRLNEKAYIIPGLGDAGDLCYGQKL